MTPTPRARALAKELRAAREAVRLSQTELGTRLGWGSKHTASRIENARYTPNERELGKILDALDVQGADRDRLMRLGRDVDQRAWWETQSDSAQFAAFVDAEDRATSLVQSSVNIIPGLLQTRDYARAVIEQYDGRRDVEHAVNIRLMRQGILTRARAVDYATYLDESCLARAVGGPAVMTEQLHELHKIAQRDNVRLRIIPFRQGAYFSMVAGFRVAHFVRESPVVQLEQGNAVGIIADPDDVEPYLRATDSLEDSAISYTDSLGMVADYLTHYERESPCN